jgi:hypothetical protein
MKQGFASRTVLEKKTEPIPHKVTPAYTTQLGASTHYKKDPIHSGRGYKAPMDAGIEHHKSGSQGRH